MDKGCIVRNIIKEIVKECKPFAQTKGISIHENFVSYYVNLLILDPKWGITEDRMPNRADVQHFIKHVVDRLVEDYSTPSMVMMKMQFYFSCNFDHRLEVASKNRSSLMARISPIKNDIIQTQSAKKSSELQDLYKKMVYYITLGSGLGNPTIDAVYKEALTALKSVLFENELKEYCRNSPKEKEELLADYMKLVTGIRLFNKDNGKGGKGMSDLPGLMNSAMSSLITNLQSVLAHVMERVFKLTAAIDNCYIKLEYKGRQVLRTRLPENVTKEELRNVKSVLTLYRQYELYLRKIFEEANRIQESSRQSFDIFKKTLIKLHHIVQYRIAIPCQQVFPVFRELHEIWTNIQDEAILLAKIDQILTNLARYMKIVTFNTAILDVMIGDNIPLTDIERMRQGSNEKISESLTKPNLIVKPANTFKDLDNIPFQCLGFCCYKFVETDGGLMPGNPNLGVIRSEGMYFAFSNRTAAEAFAEEPDKYVCMMLEMARRRPELITFFNLHDQLRAVMDQVTLIEEVTEEVFSKDEETQVDLHIIEEYIDPTYKWNIWDLKREALKLADLSKMATVHVQTDNSSNLFNIGLQTFEYRNKLLQTKRDNYTNVPTPSIYLFGLRGRTDDMQLIVDLTRPVEE